MDLCDRGVRISQRGSREVRERPGRAALLAEKREGHEPRACAATGSCKRQGNAFSPSASDEMRPENMWAAGPTDTALCIPYRAGSGAWQAPEHTGIDTRFRHNIRGKKNVGTIR